MVRPIQRQDVRFNRNPRETRSSGSRFLRPLGFALGLVCGLGMSLWFSLSHSATADRAWSGAELLGQRSPLPSEETGFAESRFGAPPGGSSFGAGRGVANRRIAELEEREDTLPPRFMESGKRWNSDQIVTDRAPASQASPLRASAAPEGLSIQAEINKKGVQEVSLIAGDLGYFPKAIFVTKDVPVRMYVTGASKNSLCIMMDSFQVRKQVRSQRIEEITFMPQTAGTYRFYCPVNGMEGKLVVREVASVRGGVE